MTESSLLCPLLSSTEKHVECLKEQCAWYLQQKGCAIHKLAVSLPPSATPSRT